MGRPWYRGYLPQIQAAPKAYFNEVFSTLQDLPRPPEGLWRPRQVPVPHHPSRLYNGPLGGPAPLDVLGLSHHVNKGRRISCPLFQGLPWSNTGWPPLYHDIQCCCGRRHVPLGNGCDRGGGSTVWPRVINTAPGGIFLCQRRTGHVNVDGTPTTGFWIPHGLLWICQPEDEHTWNGKHGLPSMPLTWRNIGGGLNTPNFRGGTNVSG